MEKQLGVSDSAHSGMHGIHGDMKDPETKVGSPYREVEEHVNLDEEALGDLSSSGASLPPCNSSFHPCWSWGP